MCYEYRVMFLAKSWKTVNGKRYPKWDLKKSIWDKEKKRQRQVYVAYIGTERKITWDQACEICRKKEIEMAELQSVKRLKIEKPVENENIEITIADPLNVAPPSRRESVPENRETDADVGFDVPEATPAEMVRELRAYYGLGTTFEDYDDLAYRIDPSIEAEELRMVEDDRAVLGGRAQERMRGKWQWMKGKEA